VEQLLAGEVSYRHDDLVPFLSWARLRQKELRSLLRRRPPTDIKLAASTLGSLLRDIGAEVLEVTPRTDPRTRGATIPDFLLDALQRRLVERRTATGPVWRPAVKGGWCQPASQAATACGAS
jgi:hypothetical protein